jgi:hypothetical protein
MRVVGLRGLPPKFLFFWEGWVSEGATQSCATLALGRAFPTATLNVQHRPQLKFTTGGLMWRYVRLKSWKMDTCGSYCFNQPVKSKTMGYERHSGRSIEKARASMHETSIRALRGRLDSALYAVDLTVSR